MEIYNGDIFLGYVMGSCKYRTWNMVVLYRNDGFTLNCLHFSRENDHEPWYGIGYPNILVDDLRLIFSVTFHVGKRFSSVFRVQETFNRIHWIWIWGGSKLWFGFHIKIADKYLFLPPKCRKIIGFAPPFLLHRAHARLRRLQLNELASQAPEMHGFPMEMIYNWSIALMYVGSLEGTPPIKSLA